MLTDTHSSIEKILIDNYRKRTVLEKLKMVKEINQTCQSMALAGIKQRYPDADDGELRLRLGALWLDKKIMLKVYDWNVDEKGL